MKYKLSMADFVFMKRDAKYVHDMQTVRGMKQGTSDRSVLLCKFKLMGIQICKRGEVNGAGRIKSQKLREQHYKEGFARTLEIKIDKEMKSVISNKWGTW